MVRPTRQCRVSFSYSPAQLPVPENQIVESNENDEHSLGRATEKESRARYCSTLITAGTNAIDELVFGSTIRESLASL